MTAAEAIEGRMRSGEPFTYGELCAVGLANGGNENRDRLADKTIQKWRRKGWIEMRGGQVRGRAPLWFYIGGEPS